jgi:hypothetical protein
MATCLPIDDKVEEEKVGYYRISICKVMGSLLAVLEKVWALGEYKHSFEVW